MTCWVKLPTPALPGSGSRRPETAVCFDLSRGCPSAPLFLCPNLLYTPTADCQAFQILSTRFPPGFTRFLQCSFICTGYTAAVLKKHPDRSDRYEEKAYFLRGCEILKPSPAGEGFRISQPRRKYAFSSYRSLLSGCFLSTAAVYPVQMKEH